MPNISDILNRPAEDVEAPKPLPPGSYRCVIKGLPEQGESSKKKTPFLKFNLQITSAAEDVDEEALAEYEGEDNSVVGKLLPATFYVTDDALFMLTEFLEALGIDFSGGKSISAAIEETPNCECLAFVKHEPSMDGSRFYARFAKAVAIPEAA